MKNLPIIFTIITLTIPSFFLNSFATEKTNLVDAQIQQRERLSASVPEPAYSKDDIEAEIVFGRELASKITGKYKQVKNNKLNQYVNKVGQLVARNSVRSELSYRFLVIKSKDINAFATPGAYVFITTGALNQVQDESELAAILAHEIAHVEKRHYVKKVGIRSNKVSPEQGFVAILTGGGASAVKAFQTAIDETLEILFNKGLQSHKDEFEADEISIWLLANTGYDPTALSRYFKRISSLPMTTHNTTTTINKTHPSLITRYSKLDELLQLYQLNNLQQATLEDRFNANK